MRKIKLVALGMLVLLFVVACANFDSNAYKSLRIAQTSYDTGMRGIGDLQKQGKLTNDQVKVIWQVANAYYMAYLTAEGAYEVYHSTKAATDQDKLITALTAASAKLGELIPIFAQYSIIVSPMPVPQK